MTEEQWLVCTDPTPMLQFLRSSGKASERKLRLFATGCCRRVFHLLGDRPSSRKTIEFAEDFADGRATKAQLHGNAWGKPGQARSVVLRKAIDAAEDAAERYAGMVQTAVLAADAEKYRTWRAAFDHAWRVRSLLAGEACDVADAAVPAAWVAAGKAARREEHKAQCDLLRCIFGRRPFRPLPPPDPAWLAWNGGIVPRLAEAIYADGAFSPERLGVLADALEESGCDVSDVLGHLRQRDAVHVRGCFAVDWVLGKA